MFRHPPRVRRWRAHTRVCVTHTHLSLSPCGLEGALSDTCPKLSGQCSTLGLRGSVCLSVRKEAHSGRSCRTSLDISSGPRQIPPSNVCLAILADSPAVKSVTSRHLAKSPQRAPRGMRRARRLSARSRRATSSSSASWRSRTPRGASRCASARRRAATATARELGPGAPMGGLRDLRIEGGGVRLRRPMQVATVLQHRGLDSPRPVECVAIRHGALPHIRPSSSLGHAAPFSPRVRWLVLASPFTCHLPNSPR